MTTPCAVYELYDADRRPLYVGIGFDPEARWRSHARQPWWSQVAAKEVTWFASRYEAMRVEAAAIAAQRPPYNTKGNPDAGSPYAPAEAVPSETKPPLQRLADLLLGECVVTWIQARREADTTFRQIVRDLLDATDGRIDITQQTARMWLRDYSTAAA